MAVRRLHWLGSERRRRLTAKLSAQLGEWLGAWSVDGAWLRLADRAGEHPPGDERAWRRLATAQGAAVWLGVPRAQLAAFGGRLAAAPTVDDFSLGERLGLRALDALLARWAGANGSRGDAATSPGSELFAPRHGHAAYTLRGDGFDAVVVFEHDLVETLAPAAMTTGAPLAARDSALGEEAVDLDVVLDLGPVALGDASSLQVGDVLLSDVGVDALFRLVHPDLRTIADARLFQRGESLALQIHPHTSKRTP